MENKFNLFAAQKRGMASTNNTVNYLIGGLIAVVLVASLAGTLFGYLGTETGGLGNSSENPAVPVWLSPVLIIVVAIGLLYLVLRAMNVTK